MHATPPEHARGFPLRPCPEDQRYGYYGKLILESLMKWKHFTDLLEYNEISLFFIRLEGIPDR